MSLQMKVSTPVSSFPNQRKKWSSVLARRWAEPEQARARRVDLTDEREEIAPVLPMDLVNTIARIPVKST